VAGSDLLERLKARTSPVRQAKRGPQYNHPYLWYCKPDGDVVLLQGDPPNRAYYEDKGYTVLRPEERAEWEAELRPLVVAAQQDKAELINVIRQIGSKHPGVQMVPDLDELELDELRALLDELGQATGAPVKVIGARFRRQRAAVATTDHEMGSATLAGGDELQRKLEQAAKRGN
jgi:hypothetical protein